MIKTFKNEQTSPSSDDVEDMCSKVEMKFDKYSQFAKFERFLMSKEAGESSENLEKCA